MSLFHVKTQTVPDSTATSLVRPSDWNSAHAQAMTLSGNTAGQSTFSGTNIVFQGGNNVTLSAQTAAGAATIIFSGGAGGPGGGGVAFSAGTNSTSTGTVVFANSNGLTFGMDTNGSVTGSYTVPSVPAQTAYVFSNSNNVSFGTNGSTVTATASFAQSTQPVAYSAANGSANFSTLTFANSNGVSFSTGTQGVYATVKTDYQSSNANYLTSQSNQAFSAANGSQTFQTITFANSNGVSFSTGTQGLYASHDGFPSSATTKFAGTGTTFNGTNVNGSLTLNSNGIRVDLSVSPGGAADGYNSAQFTNSTANSTMPLLWAGNSNGSGNITLGLTGSTITGSAPSGGAGAAISAGAASQNTGTVIFSNSNGVSFGLNAGTLTASHNGLTQQSTQPVAYSAGNGSANFSTLKFADSQGVSFSTGTQGIYATVKTDYQSSNANYLTSQSNQAISAANGSFTFQTATFANSNGVSFSTGTQGIYASHNGITQQSTQPVAYSAANGSANFSTLTFANSNGVSFSTGTQGLYATVKTDYQSSNANYLTSQSAQTANFYVSGNSTQLSSTAGLDLRSITFEGAGIASVGVSNGRVLVSVPTGGGAGDGVNVVQIGTAGTTGTAWSSISGTVQLNGSNGIVVSQNNSNQIVISYSGTNDVEQINLVGNNTAGTTSVAPGNTMYLSGGNNVTLSGNNNTIVISAAAGGGGFTQSKFMPHLEVYHNFFQVGQNSIQVQPIAYAPTATYDRLAYGVRFSGATNSTMTVSCTVQMGIYTLNGSTLSLLNSASGSFSINGQGTANSTINSGPRWATMTLNNGGLISGDIWVAFRSSTNTAGVNASLSNLCASRVNSSWSGFIGVGTAASAQSLPGMGYYSATSNGMPSSMAISHITGVSSTAQLPQIFFLSNGAFPT